MPRRCEDGRIFCSTDRPGERLSVTRPASGFEILSVRNSHRHWREAHECFTVAVVHREQQELLAEWRTRCRSLSTERGGLMLIEPGDVHVTQRLYARRGVADFDVVRIAPELVDRAAERLDLSGNFHFRAPTAQDPVVFEAFRRLVAAVARSGDALTSECAANEALAALLTRLGERPPLHSVSLAPERDFRLRRVKEYLAGHLERRPTLSELEQVSGLSQWRLCVNFNKSQGTSIGRFWNALRLARAVRQLQEGRSIQLIVAELGYRDEAYFWRAFKSHYGITPGAWRAMFRANDRAVRRPMRLPAVREIRQDG
jgi:AraC-like DNA-binding protein